MDLLSTLSQGVDVGWCFRVVSSCVLVSGY